MTKTAAPPTITITLEERIDEGCVAYEGTFRDFPDWEFSASVAEDIVWDTDFLTEHPCTRLVQVVLSSSGLHVVSNPEYHNDVGWLDIFDQMFAVVDRFFGPSIEERRRLSEERDAEREHITRELGELIEHHLPNTATDDLRRALLYLAHELKAVETN